jgi:hypothetical protein
MDYREIWDYFKTLPFVVKEEFGAAAIWVGLVLPAITWLLTAFVARLADLHVVCLFLVYYMFVALVATISKVVRLRKE